MEQSPLPHHCCKCIQEQLRYSHNCQVRNLTNKYMENFLSNIFTTYIFNTASSTDISKWFLSFIGVPVSPWRLIGLHHLWTETECSCSMEMCTCLHRNPWRDLAGVWRRMARSVLLHQRNPTVVPEDLPERSNGFQFTAPPMAGSTANTWLKPYHQESWPSERTQDSSVNKSLAWVNYQGWHRTCWDQGRVLICYQRQLSRDVGSEDSRRVTCGCLLSSIISDGSSQGLCIARGVSGQHVARACHAVWCGQPDSLQPLGQAQMCQCLSPTLEANGLLRAQLIAPKHPYVKSMDMLSHPASLCLKHCPHILNADFSLAALSDNLRCSCPMNIDSFHNCLYCCP